MAIHCYSDVKNATIANNLVYGHTFRPGILIACATHGGKNVVVNNTVVDNATGTGFVHIAPGHGLDDYHLGTEHGLPIYSPVDDDGKFTLTADLPQEQQMPQDNGQQQQNQPPQDQNQPPK